MTSSMAYQGKLDSVQVLRGVAALLVVLFHCAAVQKLGLDSSRHDEIALLSGFWDRGYAGVDLFFVISGFIMVYVTRHKRFEARDISGFLYNRITRIYPLWWVFASIMAIYFFVTYGQLVPSDRSGAGTGLEYFLKSLFLIPQSEVPILGVGWTLIHEVYFYIIFALFLFFDPRKLPIFLLFWLGVTILYIMMGSNEIQSQAYRSVIASWLTLEFIAGAFTALLITQGIFKFEKFALGLGGVLFCLAMLYYTDTGFTVTRWGRVAVYTLPFILLTYGLVAYEKKKNVNFPRFLILLGDWSYSLYLSHYLVFLTVKRLLESSSVFLPESLHFQAEGWVDNLIFTVISLTATIMFSALCYKFIESPLLRASRRLKKVSASASIDLS